MNEEEFGLHIASVSAIIKDHLAKKDLELAEVKIITEILTKLFDICFTKQTYVNKEDQGDDALFENLKKSPEIIEAIKDATNEI